ncbi:hypothetical protein ACJZ2D_016245 [Fusarium nematophilum]
MQGHLSVLGPGLSTPGDDPSGKMPWMAEKAPAMAGTRSISCFREAAVVGMSRCTNAISGRRRSTGSIFPNDPLARNRGLRRGTDARASVISLKPTHRHAKDDGEPGLEYTNIPNILIAQSSEIIQLPSSGKCYNASRNGPALDPGTTLPLCRPVRVTCSGPQPGWQKCRPRGQDHFDETDGPELSPQRKDKVDQDAITNQDAITIEETACEESSFEGWSFHAPSPAKSSPRDVDQQDVRHSEEQNMGPPGFISYSDAPKGWQHRECRLPILVLETPENHELLGQSQDTGGQLERLPNQQGER